MIKHKIQSKISLQLLLAIIISFIVLLTASTVFSSYLTMYYISNIDKVSPAVYNLNNFLLLLVSISSFVLTFFLLINRKVRYIKYIAKRVTKITNEGFGAEIKIRGKDELAELCRNINTMSKELKRKFDLEKEFEKSKSELIRGVSHDLRTPLTSIKGYLQLIKDKQYRNPEEIETFIHVAYNKTEMLESLIENLFEYTRLTGKEVQLDFESLCINDIVEQVVMDYGPLFEKEKLNLELTLPHQKHFVRLDPDKFVRVLENLLGNALKYSSKPGNVSVSLNSEDQGILITVKNQGQNLDPESLSRLFDHFYRVEQSRSKDTGGTGLGLAIAKSIVELHNGRIWAESENGMICFKVWLPINDMNQLIKQRIRGRSAHE